MRRIALTLVAAFALCGVAQRSLSARDPVIDPNRESKETVPPQKATHPEGDRLGPPETLIGTITMVEPSKNLIVVRDKNGTLFNFVTRRSTRIVADDRRLTVTDLSASLEKTVSIRFVPARRGNLAQLIELKD
jgi:hypothetical protein